MVTKRIRIVLTLAVALAMISGLVLWALREPPPPPTGLIPLPDGSWVSLEAVTYGTNHLVGSRLALLTYQAPPPVQRIIRRIFGKHSSIRFKTETDSPKLVLWLHRRMAARFPAGMGYMECLLSDTNGFMSGENVFYGAYYPLEAKEFAVFPRREREFVLTIYHHNLEGEVRYCGQMMIPNPVYWRYPQWTPEPLPATKLASDVEVTLHQVITGVSEEIRPTQLADRRRIIELAERREGEANENVCRMTLRSLLNTNEVWCLGGVTVSDATGNRITNRTLERQDSYFTFTPGLWTNEAAWKLSCKLKRVEGFLPEEQFTFSLVPLGSLNTTNPLRWVTNFQGVTVTLEHIIRRPPGNDAKPKPASNMTQVEFRTSGLTNGLELDLVAARISGGKSLTRGSWSGGAERRNYEFWHVPVAASTVDFTFAVQTNRTVEFIVKPETRVQQLELPANEQ